MDDRLTGSTLEDLAAEAREIGWATGDMDLGAVRSQATRLNWVEVPVRRGDSPVAILQPSTADDAHPASLSSTYGLGRQPLHTDGAHLRQPPKFVIFASESPSETPTHVVRLKLGRLLTDTDLTLSSLEHGMFLVRNHRESFFAPVLADGRYRFDSGCMSACDNRAAAVASVLSGLWDDTTEIEWTKEGQVLVIDNRQTLHARAGVSDADLDRTLARVAFETGET